MMEYFENKNIRLPKLGFGTWKISQDKVISSVEAALNLGYRHIDAASIYGNEDLVGTALQNSAVPRSDIFLTTKIWRDYLSSDGIQQEAQKSLKKLKTDYVDLLLIHWPNNQFPLEESLKAFENLVQQGQTRFIGVSNFPISLLKEALKICPSLITNQVEYHPFLSQQKLLDFMRTTDMFLTAYSPLARGEVFKSDQIKHIALKYQKTEAQIVLRWLVEQDSVITIVKSESLKNIENNLKIFDFELEKEDQDKLFRLSNQKRKIVDPPFAPEWD